MKFATKLAALICSGVILVASCKKKEENTTPTVTKTKKDYLVEGKWQLASAPVSYTATTPFGNQTQNYNQIDSMDACEKDNFIYFKSWGKVYNDEGATKCSTTDPQVDSTSTWVLNSDNTKLTMPMEGMNSDFTIQELSATDLKMTNQYDTAYTISGFSFNISMKTTMEFKNKN